MKKILTQGNLKRGLKDERLGKITPPKNDGKWKRVEGLSLSELWRGGRVIKKIFSMKEAKFKGSKMV